MHISSYVPKDAIDTGWNNEPFDFAISIWAKVCRNKNKFNNTYIVQSILLTFFLTFNYPLNVCFSNKIFFF